MFSTEALLSVPLEDEEESLVDVLQSPTSSLSATGLKLASILSTCAFSSSIFVESAARSTSAVVSVCLFQRTLVSL